MESSKRPILAVVSTLFAPNQESPKPGGTWSVLEERAHALGLQTYFFDPNAFDYENDQVIGWVRERAVAGEPKWMRQLCSMPDVVYENVYVHLENAPSVRKLRGYFQSMGIPLFNPDLGDKWQLAQWLKEFPNLFAHHPESILLRTAEEVFPFLQKHAFVYLKPIHGSAGQGILEIRPRAHHYLVRAAKYSAKQIELHQKMTADQLLAFVRREIAHTDFLLQVGCDLLHENGGKIDLRTHLQRNKRGVWECVELVVKQGKPHSIVSNYHAGGACHDWQWLEEVAKRQGVTLPSKQEVITLSHQVATAFTAKENTLAGLGFDIGIDRQGRMWVLDINCPPGRNILSSAGKRRCQQLNAEFATYLLRLHGYKWD